MSVPGADEGRTVRRGAAGAALRSAALLATLSVALVLVGCTGSSSSSEGAAEATGPTTTSAAERAETAAAFAEALATGYSTRIDAVGSGVSAPADQLLCTTTSWVDTIGVDAFEQRELTTQAVSSTGFVLSDLQPSDDQRAAMARAVLTCGLDLTGMFNAMASAAVPADQLACIDDQLAKDPLSGAELFTRVLADGGVTLQDEVVLRIAAACSITLPEDPDASTTTVAAPG